MPQAVAAAIVYVAEAVGYELAADEIAVQIASYAITAAITYGVGQALTPGPKGISAQTQQQAIKQAVAPRRRYYGTVKASGIYAFLKAKDNYLYSVIMIASQQIDAVNRFWLNDIDVTAVRDAGTGFLTGSRWVSPSDSNGGPYHMVEIQYQPGDASQFAYGAMTAAWPLEWTSNHRLDGIFNALLIERAANKDFSKYYPSGPYNLALEFRGARVWDPRVSGQDPNDEATWTWSDNLALVVLDYLRHPDGMGLPWTYFENVLDDWANQANICDEDVELAAGGTEKRYRLSGGYDFSQQPVEALPLMLEPAGASLETLADGSIVLRVMRCGLDAPSVVFTEDHIISYKLRRSIEKATLRNEIRATFTDPNNDYQQQESDPWQNQASIDVNGLQSVTLDLPWCPSASQARRRQKVEAYRLDPEWSGTITVNLYGLDAMAERFIAINLPELLIDGTFEKLSFQADVGAGTVTMQVRSFPAAALDWTPAEEEGTAPVGASLSEGSDNFPAAPAGLTLAWTTSGGSVELQASCDPSGREDLFFQADWSTDGSTWTPFTSQSPEGGYSAFYLPAFYGVAYTVRARFVSFGGLPSDYATGVITPTATAPPDPTGSLEEVSL